MGDPDVDALLARMSSRQLSEWMAYYAIEPFGEERADLRAAMIACLIANANRDEKKRREPYTVQDFMPFTIGDQGSGIRDQGSGWRQTWQEQKAMMMALFPPNSQS